MTKLTYIKYEDFLHYAELYTLLSKIIMDDSDSHGINLEVR